MHSHSEYFYDTNTDDSQVKPYFRPGTVNSPAPPPLRFFSYSTFNKRRKYLLGAYAFYQNCILLIEVLF